MKVYRIIIISISMLVILSGCKSKEEQFVTACYEGKMTKVVSYLKDGMSKDARYGTLSCLMMASSLGHINIVEKLILLRADPNFQNKVGSTALLLAIPHEHYELANMLVQYDATDVDIQNKYGATALMLAGNRNQKDLVQAMLQRGADISITNEKGETALQQAEERGLTNIVRLLQKYNHIANESERTSLPKPEPAYKETLKDIQEDKQRQIWKDFSFLQQQGLNEQDEADLIAHYQITEDQYNAIQEAGYTEGWKQPVIPTPKPTPLPTATPPQRKTLNVSYEQVMGNGLSTYLTMEKGAPIDGLENYVGNSKGCTLQLIGHKRNLSEVGFIMVASQNEYENTIFALYLKHLLLNIFPTWNEPLEWANESITRLQNSSIGSITKTIRDKKVTMSLSREFGMINIVITPNT